MNRVIVETAISVQEEPENAQLATIRGLLLTDPTKVSLETLVKALQLYLDEEDHTSRLIDWQILALACSIAYCHTLNALLGHALPINSEISYWQDVMSSGTGLGLYYLQNSPVRLFKEAHVRLGQAIQPALRPSSIGVTLSQQLTVLRSWKLVKPSTVLYLLLTPVRQTRQSLLQRQKGLNDTLKYNAKHIGGLVQGFDRVQPTDFNDAAGIEAIALHNVRTLASAVEVPGSGHPVLPDKLTARAVADAILDTVGPGLRANRLYFELQLKQLGRPNRVVRYWPAAFGGLVVGLKVLGNWRAILHWINDVLIGTAVDFYNNWILDPILKVYQTIRHDETAQIALLSKQSLDSDMQSLERMVFDFVRDSDKTVGEEDLAQLRDAISKGDMTAVMQSYEQQIQAPLSSLLRGHLIRSLLIQVQKTKVDVEVAMNGIDKLLKSQQLVFGTVAALPSFAGVYWAWSYIAPVLRGDARYYAGLRQDKEKLSAGLAKITRILGRQQREGDRLSLTGLGMVLCETLLLRELGRRVLSRERLKQWLDNLNELEEIVTELRISEAADHVSRMWLIHGLDLHV
ncbi:nuclear control of ATPase protein 2 [Trichomonascus vanleenenianus]|uniref:Nca2p n=1 Tax=Trichomonascus vanleenenianus TaxID=2268995 RepID=UPI003EC9AB21